MFTKFASAIVCLILFTAPVFAEQERPDVQERFHRVFEGRIGKSLDIRMELTRIDEELTGTYYYKKHRIPLLLKGSNLTEAGLFGETLELNHNWFITPEGLGFSYSPYEIACYARGFVKFVIPWKDVRPWLKNSGHLARLLPPQ